MTATHEFTPPQEYDSQAPIDPDMNNGEFSHGEANEQASIGPKTEAEALLQDMLQEGDEPQAVLRSLAHDAAIYRRDNDTARMTEYGDVYKAFMTNHLDQAYTNDRPGEQTFLTGYASQLMHEYVQTARQAGLTPSEDVIYRPYSIDPQAATAMATSELGLLRSYYSERADTNKLQEPTDLFKQLYEQALQGDARDDGEAGNNTAIPSADESSQPDAAAVEPGQEPLDLAVAHQETISSDKPYGGYIKPSATFF